MSSGRAGELQEMITARALRAVPISETVMYGTVASYNPADDTVIVNIWRGGDEPDLPYGPMPIRREFVTGSGGATGGTQHFVPAGVGAIVATNSPSTDDHTCVGFFYTKQVPPPQPTLKPTEGGLFGEKGQQIRLAVDGLTPGDGAGSISIMGTPIGVGDLISNLPVGQAAVVKSHLDTLAANIQTVVQNAITSSAALMVTSAIPNAATYVAGLTASWLSSHIPAPTVPAGINSYRIKNY